MATNESSVADVVKNALRDAEDLVRSEIALAKAELRQEARRMSIGAGLFAGAALGAIIAIVFLLTAIAWAIAEVFVLPAWIGFGAVALAMFIVAGVLAMVARSRMAVERHMPQTVDTLKENMQWIRARTS